MKPVPEQSQPTATLVTHRPARTRLLRPDSQQVKDAEAKLSALTPKQRLFVREYLAMWNQTEAARRAGYSCPSTTGWQTFENPCVKAVIEAALRAEHLGPDQILARLAEYVHFDPTVALKGEGGIDWEKVRKMGRMVKRWKAANPRTGAPGEVEFHDPLAALIQIGKYWGLFKDRDEGGKDAVIEFVVHIDEKEVP